MALTSKWLFFSTLLLLYSGPSALAESSQEYLLKEGTCPVSAKKKGSKKWSKLKKGLPLDTVVYGQNSRKKRNYLIFKLRRSSQITLAAKLSCFKKVTDKQESIYSPNVEIIEGSNGIEAKSFDARSPKQVSFFAGGQSWQEKIALNFTDINTQYEIHTTSFGFCAGANVEWQLSSFDYGFSTCFFLGKSYARYVTDETFLYEASNANIYGLMSTANLMFKPKSGSVKFGLNIPFFVRKGSWPVQDQMIIKPSFALMSGAFLEGRYYREKFYYSQKVGFMQSLSNFSSSGLSNFTWQILGGYVF